MKINKKIIEEIRDKAKSYFVGASGCHDWTHIERVHNLAIRIAKKEKADIAIVSIAAYLHDIGRKEEMKKKGIICHAEKGAEEAKRILSHYSLEEEVKDNIIHCILSHRFRNNHIPKTIEAKIIYDADKLDSIGSVGVGRAFLFAGFLGNGLYTGNEKNLAKVTSDQSFTKEDTALLEYHYKLKKVKSGMMTKTGKIFAEERHKFMTEFFKRFEKEVNGTL